MFLYHSLVKDTHTLACYQICALYLSMCLKPQIITWLYETNLTSNSNLLLTRKHKKPRPKRRLRTAVQLFSCLCQFYLLVESLCTLFAPFAQLFPHLVIIVKQDRVMVFHVGPSVVNEDEGGEFLFRLFQISLPGSTVVSLK